MCHSHMFTRHKFSSPHGLQVRSRLDFGSLSRTTSFQNSRYTIERKLCGGEERILQDGMIKFWELEVPGYSQGHEAKEGSKVVLGGTSREQTLQQSSVISGIEDPNLKRQSKGYRDAEVIRPIGIRFRWRYFWLGFGTWDEIFGFWCWLHSTSWMVWGQHQRS